MSITNYIGQALSQPVFGISLTLFTYQVGLVIQRRAKTNLAHPMLLSCILIIAFLLASHIPYEVYNSGATMLSFMLGPATVALAVPLYRQIRVLAYNWQAVVVGIITGSLTGVLSALMIALLFKAPMPIILSLVPKSVTTPIAVGISETIGGIPPLTAGIVVVTGILGSLIGPGILNLINVRTAIARGIAIGSASHAIGTNRAMQEGELQGAVSGVSIALVGLTTAVLTPGLLTLMGITTKG